MKPFQPIFQKSKRFFANKVTSLKSNKTVGYLRKSIEKCQINKPMLVTITATVSPFILVGVCKASSFEKYEKYFSKFVKLIQNPNFLATTNLAASFVLFSQNQNKPYGKAVIFVNSVLTCFLPKHGFLGLIVESFFEKKGIATKLPSLFLNQKMGDLLRAGQSSNLQVDPATVTKTLGFTGLLKMAADNNLQAANTILKNEYKELDFLLYLTDMNFTQALQALEVIKKNN